MRNDCRRLRRRSAAETRKGCDSTDIHPFTGAGDEGRATKGGRRTAGDERRATKGGRRTAGDERRATNGGRRTAGDNGGRFGPTNVRKVFEGRNGCGSTTLAQDLSTTSWPAAPAECRRMPSHMVVSSRRSAKHGLGNADPPFIQSLETRRCPRLSPPYVARPMSPAPCRPPFVARRLSPAACRPPFVARRLSPAPQSPAPRRPPFVARLVRIPQPPGRSNPLQPGSRAQAASRSVDNTGWRAGSPGWRHAALRSS
jgi:hypothetical protein